MRTATRFSAVLLALGLAAGTCLAEEALPDCTEGSVGVTCVKSRGQVNDWSIQEVVPPVGTQNTLIVSSSSFEQLPGIFGRESSATLRMSCLENTTQIEVRFGENFMSDVGDFGRLTYKLDDNTPVTVELEASPDSFALGFYTGATAIPLISEMFGAERLLVSATSFTGRTLTASFSIEGLQVAAEPLRELCNW